MEEALKALNDATADPEYEDATIVEHKGDVQNALKRPKAAKKSWQRALEIEQKSSEPGAEIVARLQKKIAEVSSSGDEQE